MLINNIDDRVRKLLKNGLLGSGKQYKSFTQIDDFIGIRVWDLYKICGFGRSAMIQVVFELARNGIAPNVCDVFERFFGE